MLVGVFLVGFFILADVPEEIFFHLSTSGNKITGHFPMSNDFLN